MEYYIKLGIIAIPAIFLLWRAIKLASYINKLEDTILSFVDLLENAKNKDLVISHFKKTETYSKILANKN